MVTIQAMLLELVQDEAVKAPEGKPDPASRRKSEPAVIDLDLAAPHDAILAELRKLGARGRLEVLNRLQMTTLDKQPAYVQLGRQEPFIVGATLTTFGQSNNVTLIQTGLLVSIVPRVAPGDAVILEIDLNESRPGRLEEGKVIFTPAKVGETIRQPSIIQTMLRSVVKVPAGKTVAVVAATSESGPRRTETLLLVSARVLNVKSD
jgi:type II secretory pathway component GspD/PulD (secretin)